MARYPRLKDHKLTCPTCEHKYELDFVDKMFLKTDNIHSINIKCDCGSTVMIYNTSYGFYSTKIYDSEKKNKYHRLRRQLQREALLYSSSI